MKRTNRFLSIILTVIMVVGMLPISTMTAFAAAGDEFTSGSIKYKVLTEEGTTGTVEVISNNYTGDITIPETVINGEVTYTVTAIGHKAFENCQTLTSVTMPDTVTTIGSWAFHYAIELTNVTLSKNLITIDIWAFWNCIKLSGVNIPDTVTTIGAFAFAQCDALTTVTIPDSVTLIGECAFDGCDNLQSVKISKNVTKLETSLFFRCNSLISVDIPDGVTTIDTSAFRMCSSLNTVNIPDSVTFINNMAFYECSSLTTVNFSGSRNQWGDITIDADNDKLIGATITYGAVDITFDTNGGNAVDPAVVKNGGTLSTLPTPTRTGYVFDGWYIGETEVTTSTVFTADTTVTAKWTECDHASSTAKPDCENGVTCSVCQGNISALGHDFSGGTVINTDPNGHYNKCSRCDETDSANAISHDFTNNCDTDCNTCSYVRSITHDYTDLQKNADEHWYICTVCDAEKPDSRAEHSGGTATCTDKAKCSVCGEEYGDEPSHGETEIKNAKTTSCDEEGYTGDKHCKACGEKLETGTAIAKTAHTYENGKCTACGATDPNYTPDSPQTGDNSNMALWIALLFVSGMGIVGTTVYGRKKKQAR